MSRASCQTTPKAKWSRRQYLEDTLAYFEALATKAEGQGSFQAAVRAKEQAAKTRAEIDQFDESQRATTIPTTPEEHRDEVLRTVRRLRASAEAGQSFVAATTLLKLETDLLLAEEARLAAASKGQDTRSAEEVLASIERHIGDLPETLRLKVYETARKGDG